MTGLRRTLAAATVVLGGLAWLLGSPVQAAEEGPDDGLVQMVIELVKDPDRDMYALGLQQVREEVRGAAVTDQLVAVLPELPPERRAGLLEALGERGDPAARPAILKMLDAQQPVVRAAAIVALGNLGSPWDVPLLAKRAAGGSEPERVAARRSLVRLSGQEVNQAIVAAMGEAAPAVRIELLGVLAARNATAALPAVERAVADPDPGVRLAALDALRYLAGEGQTGELVQILKAARDDAERDKAELALLTLCSRGGEACAGAIVEGLEDAPPAARVPLLHALARAGGSAALPTLLGRLDDEEPVVRDEVVRLLARWPTREAVAPLRQLAQKDGPLRYHVLALRGLVRLARGGEERPADLQLLADVLRWARRPQEKRLALGALGGLASPEALALVAPLLDEPPVSEEAALAAVLIAERIQDSAEGQIRATLEKVRDRAREDPLRQRAEKVLDSLK